MQTIKKPLTLKIPQKFELEEDGLSTCPYVHQSNSATNQASSKQSHVQIASLFSFADLNEHCLDIMPNTQAKQNPPDEQSNAQRILQLEQTVQALASSMHTALAGLDDLVREKERLLLQQIETALAQHLTKEHPLNSPNKMQVTSPSQKTLKELKKSTSSRTDRICSTALTLKKTQSTLKKALSPTHKGAKRGENRPIQETLSNTKSRSRLLSQQESQLGKLISAKELQTLPISQFRNKANALLQARSSKGKSSMVLRNHEVILTL